MKLLRGLLVGLMVCVGSLATAATASALTVSPAGTYNVSSGSTVLTYPSTGQRLTCTSSRITGSITASGTGTVAAGGMTFAGCSNGLLGPFTVTQTATASLQALYTRLFVSGVWRGTLAGLAITIPAGGITLTAASCRITVGGTVLIGWLQTAEVNPIIVPTNAVSTTLAISLSTTATTCSPAITIPGLTANYSAGYSLDRAAAVTQ
jgi:hypothetical protein